jgi:hypothetical protein
MPSRTLDCVAMDMTKSAVKAALGIDTDAGLASLLGVGRWAVGQWPADKAIPKARQWQLQAMHPDVFPRVSNPDEAA